MVHYPVVLAMFMDIIVLFATATNVDKFYITPKSSIRSNFYGKMTQSIIEINKDEFVKTLSNYLLK